MSEPVHCKKCGYLLHEDKSQWRKIVNEEKLPYCFIFCCSCCPDAREELCDKEKKGGQKFSMGGLFLVNAQTGEKKRILYTPEEGFHL